MIPFERAIGEARYSRAVAVTAAQSGKTEAMLDVIGSRLDQRPAPILYVGPSRAFVSDQFEPRLMALLDEAPRLASLVTRGRAAKKLLKYIAGVTVRLGYAGSSASLKSDPFALGLVDEYDEMVANIKRQGDPLGLAEARGDTYADQITAITSTPSEGVVETETDPVNGLEMWAAGDPDVIQSPIWRLWQQGSRHHFAWPCPHCREYFIPRFKTLKWKKGATPAQAERDAWVECPNCGAALTDADKPEMNAGGVMVAPGQTIEDARAGIDPEGVNYPSFWTSGLCSPFVTFGARARRYLTALESGEPDKIQTAINAGFGECFSPIAGSDSPRWETVSGRALPYQAGQVPLGGLRLFMAVDVQKFSMHYGIRAFGSRGTSWLVEKGQLYGPTSEPEIWADLEDLMLTRVNGMQIEHVFVDSGYRPNKPDGVNEHKVYEFAHRWRGFVSPVKGKDVQNPPYRVAKIEVKPDGKKRIYSIDLVWLSTDFFKSLVFSRIATPMGDPGAWYVYTGVDEDYCRQVASEVRVIENGKPIWKPLTPNNHQLDVESMLAALAYSRNVHRIPPGVTRAGVDEASAPDDAVAEAEAARAARVAAAAQVEATVAEAVDAGPSPDNRSAVKDRLRERFARHGRR